MCVYVCACAYVVDFCVGGIAFESAHPCFRVMFLVLSVREFDSVFVCTVLVDVLVPEVVVWTDVVAPDSSSGW